MKKIFIIIFLVSLITSLGIIYYHQAIKPSQNMVKNHDKPYQRIISLSPNITEILFALELGEKIVGVTRYCNYPPQAKKIAKVGGYLDPNYEAILRLEPDVVITLPEFEEVKNFLSELGINYRIVNNKTIADILASIKYLGEELNAENKANEISGEINSKMAQITERTKILHRPKVLISVGRSLGSGVLEEVYIAGKNTFYDELINYAGGNNAFQDEKIAYPMLSAEGIININPEIIIDLVPDFEKKGLDESVIKKGWERVFEVDAIKNNRIHVLGQSYTVIPGPRFVLLLEDLARIIHPEISWND